jgi:WD40 repeat protein
MMYKENEIIVEGNPDCATLLDQGFCLSTYTLDKETGLKTGTLQYFQPNLIWKCEIDAGVLDTKLINHNLISCCSDGSLIYCNNQKISSRLQVSPSCLSYLDWNSQNIFISGLDGNLHIVDLATQKISSFKLNPYEIWFVSCTQNEIYVPLSIGKILIRDMRTDLCENVLQVHDEEISSILINDDFVYTGSFDGKICVTDRRMMKIIRKIQVGGGVWRMCLRGDGIITANMDEGFKFTTPRNQQVIPTASLAYSLTHYTENQYLGCSFYDSKLLFINFSNPNP